ncbi:MAG TPA: signal peptide peptidase SppA, partial [Anaeromyxobacter sp.]
MRRHSAPFLLALAASAVLPCPAAAQVRNALDRQSGIPAGLALPELGAAAAEDAAGIGTTPAAAGFVRKLSLQWYREGNVTEGSDADGLYLATGVGGIGAGYSIEWVRPGQLGGRRYRKNTLALALGDGRSGSLGVAWNRFTSPDPAVDALASWDLGLTLRPLRHLSIGLAMLGRDAFLDGVRLPVRYDIGLATRFLGDAFTLSADLLADDARRDDFRSTHLAFGAAAELRSGLALAAQLTVPLRSEPGASKDPSAVLALTWNGPHFGVSGGAVATPERTGGIGAVRLSGERYRSSGSGREVPRLDLREELEPQRFLVFTIGDRDPYGRLLRRLAALRSDPDVAAVAVKIDDLPFGGGRVEELRAALGALRERKPVIAYVTGGGTREYWLATAATVVGVPPGSTLDVSGFSSSRLFLKDALARLGVGFEVVARGGYKSAPEPLVRTSSSPEAREMTNALLDDVFARFVGDVATARRLAPERVRALVDAGLLSSADAKAGGLVDEVLWPDELEAWASRLAHRRVRLKGPYRPEAERRAQRWGKPPVIEVVRVEGAIVAGKSRPGPTGGGALAGADTVVAQIHRAAEDGDVKAIVLRVDSPGGDGLASDLIWREVVRARLKKPVIASMGDIAASGGYLVAVGAEAIVAEPSTLTGSIGVFALKPDLSGLLAKISVSREAYARGENAQLSSVAKPWSAAERKAVEKQVDVFYALFLERVAEGRKLARADVEPLAGGRVWTGKQAFDRRLVDRLGSLDDALALARARARLGGPDDVEVRRAGG